MKISWERVLPFLVSLITVFLIVVLGVSPSIGGFEKMLDGSITFTSIIIGFLGALLAIILSLSRSEVVKHLYKYGVSGYKSSTKKIVFFKYIKQTIAFGFLNILFSIFMYHIRERPEGIFSKICFILWAFVAVYFVCSAIRIIRILILIMEKEAEYTRKKEVSKRYRLDEHELHSLRQEGIKKDLMKNGPEKHRKNTGKPPEKNSGNRV
ncbi:MAG: hypothetical protein M0Z65_10820 [Firmicutes bacterium]|nr:hypothetical protein [Bacillota bacterium]